MTGQSERQHGFCSRRLNWENVQLTQWDSKYLVLIKTPMDVTRARAHYVAHSCVYVCACVCACVCMRECVRACVCECVCVWERERESEREWERECVLVCMCMWVREREYVCASPPPQNVCNTSMNMHRILSPPWNWADGLNSIKTLSLSLSLLPWVCASSQIKR